MKRKLGICEWSLPVSGATAIEIAAEAGFEGMQIGEAGGRLAAFPLNNQKVTGKLQSGRSEIRN